MAYVVFRVSCVILLADVLFFAQKKKEIRKKTAPGALRVMTYAGTVDREVRLSEITLTAGKD